MNGYSVFTGVSDPAYKVMDKKNEHRKLLEKRQHLLDELQLIDQQLDGSTDSTHFYPPEFTEVLLSALKNIDGVAFFLVNDKNQIVFANRSLCDYLEKHNYSNNIINKSIHDALPPLSDWLERQYARVFKTGVSLSEEKLLRVDEINYLVNIIIEPVKSHQKTRYILTKISNISGIQESEKHATLLAAILDHTDDHATIKDLNLRIIGANKALIKAAGKESISEILGKTDAELFGDHEHVKQYMEDDLAAQKLKAGEYIEREEYFVYPDGQVKDTLVRKFPIFDDQGELIATANISRDISQLKFASRELRKSEGKYRKLIENQGEGVCIVDRFGNFSFANKAAERIFGVESGKLIGQSIKDFLDKQDYEIIDHQLYENLSGVQNTYEIDITSTKGEKKYLLITASPYYQDAENPEGSFLLFRDITDRRMAEKALLDSEKELLELNATKDKFFSIIAHDLKNPFGSILGFAELILRKAKKNDIKKIIHYTTIIHRASKHGFELLENLLDWSRSQNGTLKYQPTQVELIELVHHNLQVTGEIAQNKEVQLVPENKTGKLQVFCDEDMINTVIRNLVTNAIKFSKRGSKVVVSITQEDECMARVEVRDQGVGIELNDMENLFRIESSQSEKGTEGEEGTGLGLILCKEFVEKNKGKIWVESKSGEGSSFYFTVPLYFESTDERKKRTAIL